MTTNLVHDFVQQFRRGRNVWSRQEKGRAGDLSLCPDCAAVRQCPIAKTLASLAEKSIEVPVLECPDFVMVDW